jgi:hypothetical protein
MKSKAYFSVMLAAAAAVSSAAIAQDMGSLKGLAGGMDVSKLASGSAGNAAGVVEYCMKNNFLGSDAGGVKDQLMSKVTGGGEKEKTDYADGAKGLLKTGDGKSVDIGKIGEMKQSVTKKACSSVLDHAKSLL